MTRTESPDPSSIICRSPTQADAASIWTLVKSTKVLDLNSSYLYLLLCRDFADTCVVATQDDRIVGVVTAYRVPDRPHCLFIWQVAVCSTVRHCGLGLKMLMSVLQRLQDTGGIQTIEATVAPSNVASRKLFHRLADELGGQLQEREGFPVELFPSGEHEDEPLLTITPGPSGWQTLPYRVAETTQASPTCCDTRHGTAS